MIQTLKIKIITDSEQAKALHKTMYQFNAACNYVAEVAFNTYISNKFTLQPLVYRDIREKFNISSQMAIRVISKVCETYKQNKSIKPIFNSNGAIVYDQRILSWKEPNIVSLLTVYGRIKIPVKICNYHMSKINQIRGQIDLIFKNKKFYLCIVTESPNPILITPKNVLGVDLGIKNIAVDSVGEIFSSEKIDKNRSKLDILKSNLQRCGTDSAKKHLKKLSGREARFKKDTDHCISKKLVMKAKDTSSLIALENLKGIREGTTVKTKAQRHRHNSWSFNQIQQFINYKAAIVGVPVVYINPAYTSQECPICHHISQSNRPTRDEFRCVCCGFSGQADIVAARNIAARVSVNMPIVARFFAEPQAHEFISGQLTSLKVRS